ncbi:FAD-dependent thymidylate synthase (plasmid) [Rhizobium bangladeshense]|uniref:FAD-dependent thymidylate synthase n=1 Tax=Rhizobium bangladeshense TaxID=1138189 RepID=UPI001A98FAB8|nr:FAD-dependent thymidylate synthase [Rhizobium bangladeshense]QSY98638.1 FAD-dependent thymidylate synthase [Rhizobium bangladeshense]
MTIELVTQPFVKIVAASRMLPSALDGFVEQHGLSDLAHVAQDTPISRIVSEVEGRQQHNLDLLSEFAGRFCYRAWDKGRSTQDYLEHVISEAHGSVLAHGSVSFIITGVSRALTHELVRHHVGTNPSQESQRYVTAEGGEIELVGFKANRAVVPPLILKVAEGGFKDAAGTNLLLKTFEDDYESALGAYHRWLGVLKDSMSARFEENKTIIKKRAQEAARCFLPNASETRLVWTMNMRAARNVIEQRGAPGADLEIRRLAVAFTHELKRVAPHTFFDAEVYTAGDGFEAVKVQHSKV